MMHTTDYFHFQKQSDEGEDKNQSKPFKSD